ncbi:MAG: hypothetical protein AMXMBFR44_1400 [Candidatus Campbellbacteria bacterium]
MKRIVCFTFVALAILIAASPLSAVEPTPLPHPNAFAGERFGFDTAVCDYGLTFVGRPYHGPSGSVAVFRNGAHVLDIAPPRSTSRFGETVAVSQNCNRLVIGAPGDDEGGTDAGAAFIFTLAGLDPLDYDYDSFPLTGVEAGHELGQAVAVSPSGNTVALGAPSAYTNEGFVFIVWKVNGLWSAMNLQFSDTEPNDYVGFALAVDDAQVVTGAPNDFNVANGTAWFGSFYVHNKNEGGTNNWGEVMKGTIPMDGIGQLGYAVAKSGRRVALGANMEGLAGGNGPGAVYTVLLSGSTFSVEQHITSPTPENTSYFGSDVALIGNLLVVGEPNYDGAVDNIGKWSVYRKPSSGTWGFVTSYEVAGASLNDRGGWSVGLYGGHIVAGAPFSDTDGVDTGSAYTSTLFNIFSDGFELGGVGVWSPPSP